MKKLVFVFILFCFFNVYAEKKEVIFKKCVDGDTIQVLYNNKKERIRLLAIDTPESVLDNGIKIEKYGKEASNYTCEHVKNAKKIEIEFDPNSDQRDKYGRLLAYVYLDDVMLQKSLLGEGLAKVAYLYNDYLYTDELKAIEKEAMDNHLGIWSSEDIEIVTEEDLEEKVDDFFDKVNQVLDKIWEFFKKIFCQIKELFE